MKIQKSLVSLILVFGLLFCLVLACDNDGDTLQTRDDAADSRGSKDSDGAATSGLPAGTYACFTTVAIYAGQGGSGSYTYPIYNYSRQTRGSIDVKSDGTHSVGSSRCHYSYDPATKSIQWNDCAFAKASSSQLTNDDKGNQLIQVKFSGDKDVWDCTKQ